MRKQTYPSEEDILTSPPNIYLINLFVYIVFGVENYTLIILILEIF